MISHRAIKRYIYLGIIIFSLFLNSLLISSNIIEINTNFKKLYIGDKLEYILVPSNSLTISNILNKDIKWNSGRKYFNFGSTLKECWARIKINNKANDNVFFWIDGNLITKFNIYFPTKKGVYQNYFFDRENNHIHPAYIKTHKIIIKIPNNLTADNYVFFKVYSNKNLVFIPSLKIRTTALFDLQKNLILFWLYAGLMLIAGVIIFIAYLYLKEKIHLIFSLYITSWLGFNIGLQGFGNIYIWSNSLFLMDKSIFIFGNIIGWSSALFLIYMLNTKKNYPLIHNILFLGITLPVFSLSILIPFLSSFNLFKILIYQTLYILPINLSILIYISFFKKNKIAKLLLTGYFAIVLNNVSLILIAKSIFFNGFLFFYGSMLANIWWIIFFIIALLVKQKEQTSYINRLEEEMNFMQFSIENISDAALWINKSGDILYANNAFFKMFNKDKNSPLNVFSFYPHKSWNKQWNYIKNNKKHSIEIKYKKNNNIINYYEISSNYIIYKNKEYIFSLIKDITERKLKEKEILTNKKNLEVTLESIGDAVIATDIEGNITIINPVACKLTGWKKEEAIGQPLYKVFKIINAATRLPAENPVDKVLSTGNVVGLANHTILISRDKKEYQIADSGAPIKLDGQIIGIVLVFRDVTEEYILNEKLHQAEKMDAIGQLAGGIAHDFNNMINGIMSSAELLLMEFGNDLKQEIKEYIDIIIKMAEKSAHLTKQLLIFSRKSKMQNIQMNITKVVSETIEMLKRTIPKKIEIEFISKENDLYVEGDPVQIETALLNLGINARDAMPDGGKISFNIEKTTVSKNILTLNSLNPENQEYIKISVKDTGIGIPKDKLNKIFEPFFTTKEKGAGTGLGLAAVERIITHHNGFIEVSSEVGKGTEFTIFLPEFKKKSFNNINQKEGIYTGNGVIIAVEDEELLRKTLSKMLTRLGYSNKIFSNGFEFLDYYKQNNKDIDIVMLDIIMPKIYGTEIFYKIKEINPEQKIIFMSGYTKNININDFKQQGLNGFLSKPFTLSKLSQIIYDVLNS